MNFPAANRDPKVFEAPDVKSSWTARRTRTSPRRWYPPLRWLQPGAHGDEGFDRGIPEVDPGLRAGGSGGGDVGRRAGPRATPDGHGIGQHALDEAKRSPSTARGPGAQPLLRDGAGHVQGRRVRLHAAGRRPAGGRNRSNWRSARSRTAPSGRSRSSKETSRRTTFT